MSTRIRYRPHITKKYPANALDLLPISEKKQVISVDKRKHSKENKFISGVLNHMLFAGMTVNFFRPEFVLIQRRSQKRSERNSGQYSYFFVAERQVRSRHFF